MAKQPIADPTPDVAPLHLGQPELPPDRREPRPKKKLVQQAVPDGGSPQDRPLPLPPVANSEGVIPRQICENERSPGNGLKRFKVKVRVNKVNPLQDALTPEPRYILARTEAEARECYLQITGLDLAVAQARADARMAARGDAGQVAFIPNPTLIVRELPD